MSAKLFRFFVVAFLLLNASLASAAEMAYLFATGTKTGQVKGSVGKDSGIGVIALEQQISFMSQNIDWTWVDGGITAAERPAP